MGWSLYKLVGYCGLVAMHGSLLVHCCRLILSLCLLMCPFGCPSMRRSSYPVAHATMLPSVCSFMCPSVCPSVYAIVCAFVRSSVCPSLNSAVYVTVYPYASIIFSSISDGPRPGMPSQGQEKRAARLQR